MRFVVSHLKLLQLGKRKHANGLNATSNGGDASRVGIIRQRLTDKRAKLAVCEPLFSV